MDNEEAKALIEVELAAMRGQGYAALARRIAEEPMQLERKGSRGAVYQVEIQCMWEHRPGGNVLVLASIDDGGWRAFSPLTRDFIMAPDGSFVGER